MTLIDDYKSGSPRYGSSGLLTGYAGEDTPSTYQLPVRDSSGLITSYSTGGTRKSKPVITDPHVFDPLTGKNSDGLTRGEQAAKDYQANTALGKTVKNTDISAAAADTLKNTQDIAKNAVKTFSDYLDEAKQIQQQGRSALAADTKTYNELPSRLESSLSDTVKNFTNQTNDINEQYKSLNEQQAQTNQADIAKLEQENQAYADAARAVGERAFQYAMARNNALYSASGTPRSGSGYQDQLAARTLADTMIPVEQDISRNRISQLTNYITPLQQQQYAQNLQRLTGFELPVAQTLANMGITNANDVARLAANLAGRSLTEQIQYLGSLGMPFQEAQRLITTLPQALAQLQNIDANNTFYSLVQDYQPPVLNLPTYSAPTPGRPSYPTFNPGNFYNMSAAPAAAPAAVPSVAPVKAANTLIAPYSSRANPNVGPQYQVGFGPDDYYTPPRSPQLPQVGVSYSDQPGATAGGQFYPLIDTYSGYPSM